MIGHWKKFYTSIGVVIRKNKQNFIAQHRAYNYLHTFSSLYSAHHEIYGQLLWQWARLMLLRLNI